MYRKSLKAIIAVLALAYAFEASADAYSRISLSEANTPIDEVLKKIEKEAQCLFVINTQVDTKRKVNLNVQNKTVSEILDIMFKGTDVSYSIQNPNIMLSKKAASAQGNVASASATAQSANTKIITGNVTDASGETLIGLTVKVAGTSVATATDIDGNYSIKVPAGSNELEFSYIGYQTIKRPINGQNKINVVMQDNTKLLDEVVVTLVKKKPFPTRRKPSEATSSLVQKKPTSSTRCKGKVQVWSSRLTPAEPVEPPKSFYGVMRLCWVTTRRSS